MGVPSASEGKGEGVDQDVSDDVADTGMRRWRMRPPKGPHTLKHQCEAALLLSGAALNRDRPR